MERENRIIFLKSESCEFISYLDQLKQDEAQIIERSEGEDTAVPIIKIGQDDSSLITKKIKKLFEEMNVMPA